MADKELKFAECKTKAQYRTWIEENMEIVGYRLLGASWGLDRDFRKLKKSEVVELAEALRFGEWKRDFVPLLNSKKLFVMRV